MHSPHRSAGLLRFLPALVLVAGAGLGTAGCATDPQVISQANDIHRDIQPSIVTDPELATYVQAVGQRIVDTAQEMHAAGEVPGEAWMFENIQFHLVASPTPNAFTTGGTHVYFYSQLFDGAQTEDAFAAVVGHEFGHILGRHVQDSMNNQMGVLAAAGAVGIAGAALADDDDRVETGMWAAGITAGVGQLFTLGFGRDNEREADELGFKIYVRSGYDPDKFADFFESMIEAGHDSPGGLQEYLSSHPRLAERVETAQRKAAAIPAQERQRYARAPIASPEEFAALKQRSLQATTEAKAAVAAARAGARSDFIKALAVLDGFPACVGGPADGVPPEQQPGADEKIVPPEGVEQSAQPAAGRISQPPAR